MNNFTGRKCLQFLTIQYLLAVIPSQKHLDISHVRRGCRQYIRLTKESHRCDYNWKPLTCSRADLRAKVLIGLAWATAGLFSIPMLFINRLLTEQDGSKTCRIQFGNEQYWKVLYVSCFYSFFYVCSTFQQSIVLIFFFFVRQVSCHKK